MTSKKFSELFKIEPGPAEREFLLSVRSYGKRGDKEKGFYEFRVELEKVFPKKVIYSVERKIVEAYGDRGIKYVRILPHYPSELFSPDYLPEVIEEAKRIGIVTNGFFDHYETTFGDSEVEIFLPFGDGGISLLDLAETAKLFSSIIKSEFSVDYGVKISKRSDYEDFYNRFEADKEEQIRIQNELAAKERAAIEKAREEEEKRAKAEQHAKEMSAVSYPWVPSLFEGSNECRRIDDFVFECGKMKFDVSVPKTVSGDVFTFENLLPIRALHAGQKDISVVGQVFAVNTREIKKTGKISISVGITDKDASVYVKTLMDPDAAAELTSSLKQGKAYAFHGDIKKDKFDGESYISYSDIAEVKRVMRSDNAEEKRVELHIHTSMSAMDATSKPDEVVKTAAAFGHKAVAITDHGNLQAFPIAMLTAEDLKKKNDTDIKILYGLEAYFVDDTARALYGECNASFDDEFVFFDIETTGLSPLNCEITEIGAVRMKSGKLIDEFNMLVNPGVHIPENITELTGISDETVADAPPISEVLPKFLEFAGNSLLIAHNAGFDTSFIRCAADKLGLSFTNPYLDTVAMSRYVNPNLQKHKLDVLAKYFSLGDFNHHRASDDAKMLSAIFYKMVDKCFDEGIRDLEAMNKAMSEKADPLKLRTYHQIIIVKNQVGLKNLYRLVSDSYLKYFRRHPRIPRTQLEANREGLIIGSACEAGELFTAILENKPEAEIESIAKFYDYLEIQPLSNNRFLVDEGRVADDEGLMALNKRIVDLGHRLGIPVCATCDSHYIDREDALYRNILLAGMKFSDYDRDSRLYFRTTKEMLEEFSYLGEDTAREVVIENPNKIADMVEVVRPIPKGNYPPHIDGAEEELTTKCHSLAREMYGAPLPSVVQERLEKELNSIIKNGFAIMYIIARKLVENSEAAGYQVGSRGSVGSSFAATMAGITKVNPLPPHYRCPKCRHSEFFVKGEIGSGFDLPEKNCPECGTEMIRDGHDIPFETFLGFNGDKTPDIDLNFSGDVQADAHRFTEVLFGKGKAFRAGTLGALADKTAFGYVMKYLEEKHVSVNRAECDRMVSGIAGVKRTTGQHPGGIIVVPAEYDVYDFTPIQHPADDPNSDIITTHFAFTYLHDTILKLDILGHDIPTKYKRLEEYTNTNILDVPMSDSKVYKLFTSTEPLGIKPDALHECKTGTLGLPEMGSRFVRGVLVEANPQTFSDLLQISGLTHGTNVWLGNAEELIKDKICTIADVIATRDDIMLTLIHKYDLEKSVAFKIMEDVRKGRGLKPEYEEMMISKGVPEWYIASCKKIKYMFPKAHAAAYVIDALRLGWYKIYYPVEFYAAYFTAAPDGFEAQTVLGGMDAVRRELEKLKKLGTDMSQKEAANYDALQLVLEYYARGLKFLPIDLYKSHAYKFLPEDGKIRLPFSSLSGLGENAAANIMEARDRCEIVSIDQLKREAKLSKTIVDMLMEQGVLNELNETNQITIFSAKDKRDAEKLAAENAPKESESTEKAEKISDIEQISMF